MKAYFFDVIMMSVFTLGPNLFLPLDNFPITQNIGLSNFPKKSVCCLILYSTEEILNLV